MGTNKTHRPRQSGAKAEKRAAYEKKKRADNGAPEQPKRKDPRAFGVAKFGRVQKTIQRNLDLHHRKEHAPVSDRTPEVPPPVVVVVMGPPGSGKTTLIKSLVKKYTHHGLADVRGPVTVVTGKTRRVTFFECPNDLNAMVDLAKVADLVLLTVDASFGFEMETFEFLNVLQVTGFPRVMGVLTHLDKLRDGKRMRRTKKELKQRFWVEIHQGAKLFYLSGLVNGSYMKQEIHNLSLYISRIKFRPLSWRSTHPYALVDRWEDLTDPAAVEDDPGVDRTVALFGFLRGTHLKPGMRVHVAGVGDFAIAEATPLPDPVPLPETDPEKRKARRTLNSKETLLYAPMSNVGAILYDKDAIYINVPQVHFTRPEHILPGDRKDGDAEVIAPKAKGFGMEEEGEDEEGEEEEDDDGSSLSGSDAEAGQRRARGSTASMLKSSDGVALMRSLQGARGGMDERMGSVGLQLFRGGATVKDRDARAAMERDGEEDEEDGEEEDGAAPSRERRRGGALPRERVEVDEAGRARRRALFDDGLEGGGDDLDDDDEEEDEEENDFDEDEEDEGSEESDGGSSSSSSSDGPAGAKWKRGLVGRAEAALAGRRQTMPNLMEVVYGGAPAGGRRGGAGDDGGAASDSDESELFTIKGGNKSGRAGGGRGGAGGVAGSGRGAAALGGLGLPVIDDNAEDISMVAPAGGSVGLSRGGRAGAGAGAGAGTAASGPAARWMDPSRQRSTRNRFVTGDWGGKKAALLGTGAAAGDDEEDDSEAGEEEDEDGAGASDDSGELFGDFEDLEEGGEGAGAASGASSKRRAKRDASDDEGSDDDDDDGSDDADDDAASTASSDAGAGAGARGRSLTTSTFDPATARAVAAEEKARMKAAFDAEYDAKKHKRKGAGGGAGGGAGDGGGGADNLDDDDGGALGESTAGRRGPLIGEESLEEGAEVKVARQRAAVQSEINKAEFADLPAAVRARMTGHVAGTYIRLRLEGVPAEFVTRFRPHLPVLVGGLLPQEEGLTTLRMRVKKHRWHPRILKTHDPLVFSIGWRRFQSLPVYSVQDDNERHRFLKYTPEHMHCFATLHGPVTPPNTGVVAFKTLGAATSAFRIAATGVVLELDAGMRVMKKLKLTGVPHKIFKNTAFVRGMFNSELEVAKFEGAAIRTVAGVRGTVKKAVKDGPPGTFRATFEDRILASDIVFCRTWVPVEPKAFYNPITSLLDAPAAEAAAGAGAGAVPGGRVRAAAPAGESSGFGEAESDEERAAAGGGDEGEGEGDDDGGPAGAAAPASGGGPPRSHGDGLVLMRPMRDLRREAGASVVPRSDSLYTKVERPAVRKFNPLHIPRSIAAALPFASKPKQQRAKSKEQDYFNKRAVVMGADERRAHRLMQDVFTVAKEKDKKARVTKAVAKQAYEGRKAVDDARKAEKIKGSLKRKYRIDGLKELNSKRARSGGGRGGDGDD